MSMFIFDMFISIAVAILSVVTLEMYALSKLSIRLTITILSLFITCYFERHIYLEFSTAESDEFEEDMENESDDSESEYDESEYDESEYDESEYDESENEYSEYDSNISTKMVNNIMKKRLLLTTGGAILKMVPFVAAILVLGDIAARRFGGLYYLLIIIMFIFAAGVKSVVLSLSDIIGIEKKYDIIGYIILTAILVVFICFRSVLTGMIFLLGSALVLLGIPLLLDNIATGGTNVVRQKKELLSRLMFRIFSLIMLSVAVWLLSYGAIWRVDILIILVIGIGSVDMSLIHSRSSLMQVSDTINSD
ncbi:MAG: hypothetical protein K6F55_05960 [Eubacterium sp.]|nr:hypothetical protein [Eubacterium sp.]